MNRQMDWLEILIYIAAYAGLGYLSWRYSDHILGVFMFR